jgi:hypothetical protein
VRTILLNPGPVTLSAGVRAATLAADLCHREPEFLQAQSRVIDGLLAVYGCDGHWRAVTHGGSGTSAMEAMLVSLLPADARLLVLENGVYGERLAKIAEIYGIACDSLRVAWGAPLDLAAVQARLEQGGFSHLAMVHHETTTGRLNPVTEIADLCARRTRIPSCSSERNIDASRAPAVTLRSSRVSNGHRTARSSTGTALWGTTCMTSRSAPRDLAVLSATGTIRSTSVA